MEESERSKIWKHKEDEKLSNILKEFVGQTRIRKGMDEFLIKKAWEETMSLSIQKYTQNLYFSKGILYIQINSAALRHELFAERDKLKKLLNEKTGNEIITQIVIK